MQRCLELAKLGAGKTSPNPLVGAVIFDDDFNIVAEGWHEKYGEGHAEVNAVKNAKAANINLEGLSLAVNLEPCSHFGKTPPCADMLIKEGFKKVVVGMVDPNQVVAGSGILKLKNAGIEVVTGVLEDECNILNEVFIKNQVEKKPFITVKTATTLDGKIACKNGDSKWITSEKARMVVQELRNSYDAILTGSNTVVADDPSLTCRLEEGKNPIRIVVDSTLKTSPESKVYNDDGTHVLLITAQNAPQLRLDEYPKNVEIIKCALVGEKINLVEAVEKLYQKNIKSILVEAGGALNGAFIKEKLADKLIQFIAPKVLGDRDSISFVEGFSVDKINDLSSLKGMRSKQLGPDIMIEAYFN